MIDPDTPYPPEREPLLRRAHADRPLHLRPALLLAVLVGGFLGTLARYGVGRLLDGVGGAWPVGTFCVNLVGAFALGLLLHTLATLQSAGAQGSDSGRLRWFRLVLGTGFLGAFTTYSALALDVVTGLLADPRLMPTWLPLAYGVSSVLLGVAGCGLGVLLAERIHRHRVSGDAEAQR